MPSRDHSFSRRNICHLGLLFFFFLSFMVFLRCTSRTTPEVRFNDSQSLTYNGSSLVSITDPNRFSFAFVGDIHIGASDTTRLRRILSSASTEGVSFIIFLGDIVDKGEEGDFIAFKSALSDLGWNGKVITAIGNHDIFNEGWTHYRNHLGPSHYSVELGNSKFIVLDTADGTVSDGENMWLKDEVSKNRGTHLFFVSHYLPVIPGFRTYLKLSDEEEAFRLMKLATTFSVSAWLGAHYHSYVLGRIDGVDYVVAGGGGGRRMDPVNQFFYVKATVADAVVSYELKTID